MNYMSWYTQMKCRICDKYKDGSCQSALAKMHRERHETLTRLGIIDYYDYHVSMMQGTCITICPNCVVEKK